MDFPPNSEASRTKRPEKEAPKLEEPKKIEKVVTGEVVRRKKPLGKRLMETFIGGSAKSAWEYVVSDILVPAARDTIADVVSQGIERIIFGENRSSSRRGRSIVGNNYVNYQRYSSSSVSRREDPRERDRSIDRRARGMLDYEDLVISTRHEAEDVIDAMKNRIDRYDTASVGDLYEALGIQGAFTYDNYGWVDLHGARVVRVRDGYVLDLPRPEPFNRN